MPTSGWSPSTARPAAPDRARGLAMAGQPSNGPGWSESMTSAATPNTPTQTATGASAG